MAEIFFEIDNLKLILSDLWPSSGDGGRCGRSPDGVREDSGDPLDGLWH